MRYLDTERPRLFAHRGASGHVPENTLEAFAAGVDEGAAILELDVHASRDGHVVVIHDATLERTTDGSGPVSAVRWYELRALDAGYRFTDAGGTNSFRGRGLRVPLLSEVLEAFPETPLNIEIKQFEPAIEEAVLAVLDAHGARERVLLAAEDQRIMSRIRAVAGEVLTGYSATEVAEFVMACADGLEGYRPRGRALQVPPEYEGLEIVTAAFVEAAHGLGIEVHVWTINEEEEMRALLDLGVDGLMSDFPGRAAALIATWRGERGS